MTATDVSQAHTSAGDGAQLSFMGMELIWKVTSEMSGGSLCSFVQVAPPGTGVPLHIHHRDDEMFFVINGELRMQIGEEAFDVAAGDTVVLPKGKPHAFRVAGDREARVLMTLALSADSDYESMFAGLVGLTPSDFERVAAICSANNVEFIAPPVMP